MEKITSLFVSIFLLFFASCKKDEINILNKGFVKVVSTDSNMVSIKSFETIDKHIISVCRSINNLDGDDNVSPGLIVKFDQNGNVVMRKRMSNRNKALWGILPLRNGGFISYGFEQGFTNKNYICKYSDQLELISETEIINIGNPGNNLGITPPNIIELNNGNFVIVFSANGDGKGYLRFTDNNFNIFSTRTFQAPVNTNYFGCFFNGNAQINDSTLGFLASSASQAGKLNYNSMLIRTDLEGDLKSRTFIEDSTLFETTNCLIKNENGILGVTSTMPDLLNTKGTFNNYFDDRSAQLIAGTINLLKFDDSGNFISRTKVNSYPGNGIIFSANPTKDGGFILCGTVNQSNFVTTSDYTQVFLLKLDANFSVQWSKAYNSVYAAFGVDAFELKSGGYFVTGHQRTFNKRFDLMIMKTDENGEVN